MKRLAVFLGTLAGIFLLGGCGASTENLEQAMSYLENLEYKNALSALDLATEAGENERLISRAAGIAYLGLADYDSAIEMFQAALAASSGIVEDFDYDTNYYLALAYVKCQRYEEAKDTYDAILALRPKEAQAYYLRGSVFLALCDYTSAKADFDAVVEMEPQNYDRIIRIYEVLEHYGYRVVGEEYLQAALDAYENQMGAYDRGRVYYYLGEYQKAYLALEEAKSDGTAESYLYLGMAYEATGDYNYAISVYNSYINKDATNARIYNQLGLCNMALEQYSAALSAFEAGLGVEDNEIIQALSFNQAVAYEYLGQYETAYSLLNAYVKTYPDDEAAKRELNFLSTR